MSAAPAPQDPFRIAEPPVDVRAPDGDLRTHLERAVVANGTEIADLADRLGRVHADQQRFLVDLLDVADALDRLAESGVEDRQAASTTGRLLRRALRRHAGVRRADLADTVLEPELAIVEDIVVDASVPEETVVRVVAPAYLWDAGVLRRGRVVVSKQSRR